MFLTQLIKAAALILLAAGILATGVTLLAGPEPAPKHPAAQVRSAAPAAAREKGEEPADARALLDRAIKAAGGADRLARLRAVTWKVNGSLFFNDQERPASFTGSVQAPDQLRIDLDAFAVKMLNGVLVINGDKEWVKAANKGLENYLKMVTFDIGFRQDVYGIRSAQLLLPLRDKEVQLSLLGPTKINDRPALGITAKRQGRPDLNLYFDKETGLPIKIEMQVKGEKDAQERTHEYFLDDWKEFDGIKHPTKITYHRDGHKRFQGELSDIKPLEKLDDSTFAMP
jgi:hypothetical protein